MLIMNFKILNAQPKTMIMYLLSHDSEKNLVTNYHKSINFLLANDHFGTVSIIIDSLLITYRLKL